MRLILTMAMLLASSLAFAKPALPQYDEAIHKGVANCTTSSCHGRTSPKKGEDELPQNEYRRWAHFDMHAKTFETLLTQESIAIAEKLGIGDPSTADICLDCHADNPAAEFRGAKFTYEDGVSCEACHGGSENWLQSHTRKKTPHAENVANGLYPTDEIVARTELCISCHLGHPNKIASHEIMGAGHPRLRFEMSAYTTNMTPHYMNSEWDVVRGKQIPNEQDIWFLGMLTAASNIAEIWRNHINKGTWSPEISLFDCHSCHNSMNELQWQPSPYRGDIPPGQLRLNTAQLEIMSSILLGAVWPEADELIKLTKAVHASDGKESKVLSAAKRLENVLAGAKQRYESDGLSSEQLQNIRAKLIGDAGEGTFNSFMLAEQAYLSIETISIILEDMEEQQAFLENVFKTLTSEDGYVSERFQAAILGELIEDEPVIVEDVLEPQAAAELDLAAEGAEIELYTVTADTLNVRLAPQAGAEVATKLVKGQQVEVLELQGDWARISPYKQVGDESIARWVAAQFLK